MKPEAKRMHRMYAVRPCSQTRRVSLGWLYTCWWPSQKVMNDRYKIHAAQEVRMNQIFRQSTVTCSRKTGFQKKKKEKKKKAVFPYKEDICDENNRCVGVLIKSLPHFTFV